MGQTAKAIKSNSISSVQDQSISRIPFNRPSFAGNEQLYISQAIASGHVSGDGTFTRRCQSFLEQALGVEQALLTTSCTDALELSALLLDIQDGDEVIFPSFTFVSTANAFVLRGARPIFIDVRPDTLNMDETKLEALITSRTKAIVPVHYAGVGCEMDIIMQIARKYNLAVVEDNAHGLFGRYKGKYLGTFGDLATQSFHETKNFTCGEGGALLINNPAYIERAEVLRQKGTNRSKFFRGEIDKYTWIDLGSSFLPSDLLSAFLMAQFEKHQHIQRAREAIWQYYFANLSDWAHRSGVKMPTVPQHCEQAYHMFYLLMPDLEVRSRFIEHMKSRNIMAVFHYLPLHKAPFATRWPSSEIPCPVTEDISDRLVRLPFFNSITIKELTQVVAAIHAFSWT